MPCIFLGIVALLSVGCSGTSTPPENQQIEHETPSSSPQEAVSKSGPSTKTTSEEDQTVQTPTEVLDTHLNAVAKGDWRTAFELTTATARDSLVAAMVYGCVNKVTTPSGILPRADELLDAGMSLMARYTDPKNAKRLADEAVFADPDSRDDALKAISDLINDKPKFVAEYLQISRKFLPNNWMTYKGSHVIEDVTEKGTRASARVTFPDIQSDSKTTHFDLAKDPKKGWLVTLESDK